MAIDSILHILVGGVVTLFLFSNKVKGIFILLFLVGLSLGKELFDHFVVLGHCYPACSDEHISDFLFSLLFFFLYLPVLAVTQKSKPQLAYGHYVVIFVTLASTHLAFENYTVQQSKLSLLADNVVCYVK